MDKPRYTLPHGVAMALSVLPGFPPSLVFAGMLNAGLGRIICSDLLEPLAGRLIEIRVRDAGIALRFIIRAGRFVAQRSGQRADLVISASAHDFWLLAQRREDPDALFFSRRLVVEGDTELGLLAKNTLDAVDLPPLNAALLKPERIAGLIKGSLR